MYDPITFKAPNFILVIVLYLQIYNQIWSYVKTYRTLNFDTIQSHLIHPSSIQYTIIKSLP